MIQQGLLLLSVLGGAFSRTVLLGSKPTVSESDSLLPIRQCFGVNDEAIIQTSFFLSPIQDDTNPCSGTDWVVLLVMFMVVHCISWWSRWLLWEPLARWHTEVPVGCDDATKLKKIENFSQSVNAATFHVLSAIFAWRILSPKDWLWSTTKWLEATSLSFIEADFKFYYLLYAARYVSDMLSLLFEHPRSDTFAYAIHHATTVALVLFSAYAGTTRIGGVIMLFFDWADPPLLIAKALIYLSRNPTDIYQFCADRLFEIFAVTFFVTRNLIFSYVVYVCFSYDMSNYPQISARDVLLLRSMLVVLVLLMTFWLYLIIKAAINQSSNKGNVEDIRETETHCQERKNV